MTTIARNQCGSLNLAKQHVWLISAPRPLQTENALCDTHAINPDKWKLNQNKTGCNVFKD